MTVRCAEAWLGAIAAGGSDKEAELAMFGAALAERLESAGSGAVAEERSESIVSY